MVTSTADGPDREAGMSTVRVALIGSSPLIPPWPRFESGLSPAPDRSTVPAIVTSVEGSVFTPTGLTSAADPPKAARAVDAGRSTVAPMVCPVKEIVFAPSSGGVFAGALLEPCSGPLNSIVPAPVTGF